MPNSNRPGGEEVSLPAWSRPTRPRGSFRLSLIAWVSILLFAGLMIRAGEAVNAEIDID